MLGHPARDEGFGGVADTRTEAYKLSRGAKQRGMPVFYLKGARVPAEGTLGSCHTCLQGSPAPSALPAEALDDNSMYSLDHSLVPSESLSLAELREGGRAGVRGQ